jgi:hypothetical protein
MAGATPAVSTPRFDRNDITAPADLADSSEPMLANEPIEKADKAEPIDPIDSTEPTEPIDSTDPFEPMLRTEPSDRIDHRDVSIPPCSHASPLGPSLASGCARPIALAHPDTRSRATQML